MAPEPIAEKGRRRVVIVGGGFGGLTAAQALRNAPADVLVIDHNNHHTFQPLLYQVATAGLSPADIAAPIRGVLRSQRNAEVLMAEVTAVDTGRRCVLAQVPGAHARTGTPPAQPDGGDGAGGGPANAREIPYDYLVLATGARHSYFGHDEWERFAPGLKTITDATAIRRAILEAFEAAEAEQDPAQRAPLLTFVLVGAGPTGVEMAGAIAELAHSALVGNFRHIDPRKARIVLLEAGPRILAAFPEDLAQKAQAALERLGVEVRTNAMVEQIDATGVVAAGEHVASRSVFWTAGVTASPAGEWLGAEVDKARRVRVLPDLSVPDHPDVFVIGDAMTLQQDGKPLPGVAPVAMQQGRYVAEVIRRRIEGAPAPPPFHYHDKGNLATVGRSFAILQIAQLKLSGFIAWVLWIVVHIYYLIGFRNRFLVLFQWAWAYFTFQRGVRLITATESAPALDESGAARTQPAEKR